MGKMVQRCLQVPFTLSIKLICDNKSPIFSAFDLIQYGRMKHIDIDRYFIKKLRDKRKRK